ncbi:hypothetical protein G6F22_016014 [Rhizopus arrhizus]|nr:hypothetical protein G6F22_016014 [Rhizopus arrhizus]
MGSVGQPGAGLCAANALRGAAASDAHRDRAHRGLCGADRQEHRADVHHRIHGAVQGQHRHHQRHLQPLHRLRLRRADLFRAVLATVAPQPPAGKEVACPSSPLKTSARNSATTKS